MRGKKDETWVLDGKVLPRSEVERLLARRCRWWWRRSKSAHLVWDKTGFKTVPRSNSGRIWKQKRELLAFRWELARRGLKEENLKPWVERPEHRMAFEVDFTFAPLYQLSGIAMARSNAGSGRARLWAEEQRKAKAQRSHGSETRHHLSEPLRGDGWLVVIDESYSDEEIMEAIRMDKRRKGIKDLKGADSTRWAKVPWRWIELLDIAAAVKTPRFNDADRSKLSSAKEAAAAWGRNLDRILSDPGDL